LEYYKKIFAYPFEISHNQRSERTQLMTRILFVDDEENLRFIFKKVFEKHEYQIETASDFNTALQLMSANTFDLVVTDITMPGKSGIDLLRDIKKINPETYVILITGNPSLESATEAVRQGAFDYLIKPFNMSILENVIKNALHEKNLLDEKKRLSAIEQKYVENLETTLQQQSHEIQKAYKVLSAAHIQSLEILAKAADYRDDDTGCHIIKIGAFAGVIAKNLGLSASDVEIITHAAPMHDVGKIGIPDAILQKPGKLDVEEFIKMKTHTIIGANIFINSRHPYHLASGIIALTHHEKYNGEGYPRGLKGEEIHLFGRIVAVVDVFDAVTTKRVYKPAFSIEKACEIIKSEKGQHFDPDIAQCFLDSLDQVLAAGKEIEEKYAEQNKDLLDTALFEKLNLPLVE